MGKVTRAEVLRELLEDSEGYNGNRNEWREEKRQRRFKSLRESKDLLLKQDTRRARNIQRAIRHGDYDFLGEKKTGNTSRNDEEEDTNNFLY